MGNAEYWHRALVAAIKTMAQTALALIGTEAVKITDVDWVGILTASALSAIVCLLMYTANAPSRNTRE